MGRRRSKLGRRRSSRRRSKLGRSRSRSRLKLGQIQGILEQVQAGQGELLHEKPGQVGPQNDKGPIPAGISAAARISSAAGASAAGMTVDPSRSIFHWICVARVPT